MNENDQCPPPGEFYISTERWRIDFDWLVPAIQATYFGGWRSSELIVASAQNSMCYGLYQRRGGAKDRQIGFARVVSDFKTFSWLCDVVIDPEFRGRRLGHFLMETICSQSPVAMTATRLATKDRQHFYAEFGFEACEGMRRLPVRLPCPATASQSSHSTA